MPRLSRRTVELALLALLLIVGVQTCRRTIHQPAPVTDEP